MPLYDVQHAIPLTISQQDDLAQAITRIHSQKFTTPRNFVNVKFTDVSNHITYIGGHRKTANHIRANVRAGPSRTHRDWEDLCRALSAAWYEIAPLPHAKGKPEPDISLRSVIILGGIEAGMEAGFMLPKAGDDVLWLRENWAEFNERAAKGDEEMKGMVAEVKERGLLDERESLKTAAQKLEEMLGWGDSA